MGDIATATVEDTKLGFCDLVTINKNERALNAFMKLYSYNLSGLAVVDNTDTVIGNISVSDLKDIGYTASMFKRLNVTSGTFLNRKIEGGNLPKLVSANRNSTIKEVLEMYKNNDIHRVYVVTAEFHKPLGVITLSDMLGLFSTAA
jgi:CBS domain-containing protein